MDTKLIYTKISIDDVFKNQEHIMTLYFGDSVKIGRKYSNPFRPDKHPSCFFKYSRNGTLLFYDYATSKVYFNCLDIALLRTGLPLPELLNELYNNTISNTQTLLNTAKHSIIEPVPSIIQCKLCEFEESDYLYWGKYNISKEILEYFDVRKCCTTWINKRIFSVDTPTNPTYRYKEKDKIKLYRPFAVKNEKFRNNYYGGLLEGWNQLPGSGKYCIITKSRKDVMSLYSLGIPAVGVRSETTLMSQNSFELLQKRFDKLICYMDNDKVGLEMNEKISSKFQIPSIHNPSVEEKDASDWIAKNKEDFNKWIKGELESIL